MRGLFFFEAGNATALGMICGAFGGWRAAESD